MTRVLDILREEHRVSRNRGRTAHNVTAGADYHCLMLMLLLLEMRMYVTLFCFEFPDSMGELRDQQWSDHQVSAIHLPAVPINVIFDDGSKT